MIVVKVFVFLGLASIGLTQSVCFTPNREQALCIPFKQCEVFKDELRRNGKPSQEVIQFLRESSCGYTNGPWVCCGSVAKYGSVDRPQPAYGRSTPATRPPPMRNTQAPMRTPPLYRPAVSSSLTANPKSHKNYNLLPTKCGIQGSDSRIVGGNETQLDEFPWMALLEYRKNGKSSRHSCGGMLISSRYVLTAAHCVIGEVITDVGNPFRVRLGEHDISTNRDCRTIVESGDEYEDCADPHQDINIEEIIPHASYNLDGQLFNDVAVIRLAKAVDLNYFVKPVCLPVNGERTSIGVNLDVAGWGRTETRASSDVKLKTQVPVVSPEECLKRYSSKGRSISEQQFCAGGLEGVDSCSGDSGGPIMTTFQGVSPVRWYVEGIVSYGLANCGIAGWPGVYTRVSSYVNWILDNMRQ